MEEDSINLRETHKLLKNILKPEAGYFAVVIVYGITVAALTLAVPMAVQTLVNTIAYIASSRAVAILAIVLFVTLLFSGIVSVMRTYVMEHYKRRVYARLTAEISLSTIMAPHSYFEGRRNNNITHHYFEVMTLQNNLPSLMVDGFAVVLQMLVGFLLTSFYHEFLFAFNMVILLLLYVIWIIWSGGAKRNAIKLSKSKYKTAKWLTDIAAAHEFFKSSKHLDYAGKNTDGHISGYIDSHKKYFRYTFSQEIALVLVYVFASAMLLGLGGWLVVHGQLSIGQLVAAELIMSSVFFALSRFSSYLRMYYELYGAADKINKTLSIPKEELHEASDLVANAEDCLIIKDLELHHAELSCTVNYNFAPGSKISIMTEESWIQKRFVNLLKCYEKAPVGRIRLGKMELSDYDTFELRQMIWNIDRSLIVECTVKEFLRLSAPKATHSEMQSTIESLGLAKALERLEDGYDTKMTPLGGPWQPGDFLILKLVAAILAKPKVLILNQHFDAIPEVDRQKILQVLGQQNFIVLYFTNQPCSQNFDGILRLGHGECEVMNELPINKQGDELL